MAARKLGIVALVCDGIYQRYLLLRLAREFDLAGVVVHASETSKGAPLERLWRYRNPVALVRHVRARLTMQRFAEQARPLVESLFFARGKPPAFPSGVPLVRVDNVNAPEAVAFVESAHPDVVCINGTNLLREPMLALAPGIRHGFINLHTGLSPYSRGGNCDLFMLREGHPELVGITIHHIDKGIDSGDIIITARPELTIDDTYETIEAKCFRLGIDMMLVALRQLGEGRAERVRQWEPGKLFLKGTGYVYEPSHRVQVNRILANGLIADYFAHREERDRGVRLVGRQD